jgi:UDP-N-acetylglucosamine 3-dehydrogenase
MSPIRIAVAGVGRMGSNHVRVLSEMDNVHFTAVCDANRDAAQKAARKHFVPACYTDLAEMLDRETLDAVVVALPTTSHCSAALQCIERGLHVLLEKPMASSVEECSRILELAASSGIQVMTGHIERFNPVILQLKKFLDEKYLGDLYYIETVRSGPFPKRLYGSKDGVVIDLAVHDLDLVDYLFGKIQHIYAHQIQTEAHQQDIYARVMFRTLQGALGSSEFSWISPRKERSISIYGDKGLLVGNLLDQEVWFYENGDVGIDYSDNYYQNVIWGRVSEGKVIKFPIKKEEPLRRELEFFCDLAADKIRGYDPEYGRSAVRYSQAVLRSAQANQITYLNGQETSL